ncbi:MAG: hypothetical protein AAFX87_16210 [Bacteroidota bacterium]
MSYFLIIAVQVFCIIHILRNKNSFWWIWLIIFLPVIGGLVYIYMEIISKKDLRSFQADMANTINPTGRIRDLEKRLEFSDNFENRVALADAYLAAKRSEEALELYEDCADGIFGDNPHLLKQLVVTYFEVEQFEKAVETAEKLKSGKEYKGSRPHLLYILSLEQLGRDTEAEKEFSDLNLEYSYFEARVNYGQFLLRKGRNEEATQIFEAILKESRQMNSKERRVQQNWINQARTELSALSK